MIPSNYLHVYSAYMELVSCVCHTCRGLGIGFLAGISRLGMPSGACSMDKE